MRSKKRFYFVRPNLCMQAEGGYGIPIIWGFSLAWLGFCALAHIYRGSKDRVPIASKTYLFKLRCI
ncbi:hypothetical protein R52603_00462 [Paraburkholderia saeva]|uniref:Uncharacterized protein n=1 Tax=Paraburkholderia saeva TaxID=2777537 RepID=A0A9N8RVI5_9BURK|nr:hypothetical protein R52603_00462 [Paraburkholderia saeva]CAG4895174.1 hypothetical protein LMG31841_02083 [Paraburkholderia saeva]CAG4897831.1 hypothetical protein R70241_02382 [Paraburkholderia saeva]